VYALVRPGSLQPDELKPIWANSNVFLYSWQILGSARDQARLRAQIDHGMSRSEIIFGLYFAFFMHISGKNAQFQNMCAKKKAMIFDKKKRNKKRRNATKPGFQRFNQVLI